MEILKKIKNLEIFKNMSDDICEEILFNLKYKVKKIRKGDVVAFRGDKIEDLIIISSGEIFTEMQKLNGDFITVDKLLKGNILAGSFLFGKNNVFPVDVIATIDSELIYIPKSEVIRIFQSNAILLQNYLEIISNKTQFLSEKIWFSFSNKSINNKLIAYLLNNMNKENQILLQKSIKELAQMFAVARPSLSRVLKKLIDEGVIIRKGKKILEIPSKEKLLKKIK